MARRRGFFAELQHQAQLEERRRIQQERAEARAHVAAVRDWERARREAERAAERAERATATEQKAADREAKRLLLESRQAEVEELNARLAETESELSALLDATLEVDDYVDLERLRVTTTHPPFPRADLEAPLAPPTPIEAPPRPELDEPGAPTGLGSVFGGKKRHAAAVAQAREQFERDLAAWQAAADEVPVRQLDQMKQHDAAEAARREALQAGRDMYARECGQRDQEAAEANARLGALMAGLAIGEHSAVTEYIGIVLGNSVYPEILDVQHDYEFDPVTRELSLMVLIAPPDRLPPEKAFRYVKAQDEITSSTLSNKALKERYQGIVHQVALRSLHEIFEADRAEIIQTISLHVATETTDPATGKPRQIKFVGAGASREAFADIDLRNVVPSATLQHLGAAVVKNPQDLEGLDDISGVRGP